MKKSSEKKLNKQLVWEIAKPTLVLLIIAIMSAGILAVTRHFTYIDEEQIFLDKIAEFYYGANEDLGFDTVLSADSEPYIQANSKITRAYRPKDGEETLIMLASGNGAYSGTLQLLFAIKDDVIIDLVIYHSKDMPGLGKNEKSFLNKFKGLDVSQFESFIISPAEDLNDGKVSVISGASKTSTAIINALNGGMSYYKQFYEDIFGQGGINEK